jgi:glycosyltransferase involved in cell wall biosynthesis
MPSPDACLVVPVFDEAEVIYDVVSEALTVFDKVVCVDDGSTDHSAAEIARTKAMLVRHPTNLGQGAALQTGIEFALLDPAVQFFITFDADGQHQLDDASAMLEALRRDDFDIVFGSRFLGDTTDVGWLKTAVL